MAGPPTVRRVTIAAIVSACLTAAVASAQPMAQAVPAGSGGGDPPIAGDDDLGRLDLMELARRLRGRPKPAAAPDAPPAMFGIAPLFGAQPNVGFKAGVGALVEFQLGTQERTRFSSIVGSTTLSTRKQFAASVNPVLFGPANAWKFEGRNSFAVKVTDNVALGTASVDGTAPDIDYHSTQIVDTMYVRAWRQLYVGGGISYVRQSEMAPASGSSEEWQASPFNAYSAAHGYDPAAQSSAGVTVAVLYDDRDNPNDALRGWRADAVLRRNVSGLLGGHADWQELFGEARTYRALTGDKRHKLALWLFGDFITSGAPPYLSLPTSGGDPDERSARGYAAGRFRGERMVYGEMEYRGLVTRNGLIGVVAFANVSTLTSLETGARLFESAAIGGGGGLRVLFSNRSRANVCVDVGFGRGSAGVYIGLNDAF